MARTIPYNEPSSARAGDTWGWKKSLSDFPADTWTLTYTFFNASDTFSIIASSDGTEHIVDVAPVTTSAYTAGAYDWVSHVSDGTDQYQVGKSRMQVLPEISAAYDGRTHARKMLDLLNAILESRATSGQINAVRVDIANRGIQYSVENLIKLRQQYASAVRSEDDAIAIANGLNTGRFIKTRFVG